MKVNEELGVLLNEVTQLDEQDFLFVLNSPFTGDIIATGGIRPTSGDTCKDD
jgi:hypothetical protein